MINLSRSFVNVVKAFFVFFTNSFRKMSSTGETDESEVDYSDLILSAERLYRAVHNKRKRGEARLNVNKINKIVLQTLNDIIDSITAGKIVCISNKLNPL